MVEDVSLLTTGRKVNDLLSRLESRTTRDALAAEAELSMVWAISQVGDVTLEPVIGGGRQPDALSEDLFASGSAVVEVRALSDDSFSGRDAMMRTANIVAWTADRFARCAGRHLSFEFGDRSWWDGRYRRERCVDPKFEVNGHVEDALRAWVHGRRCGEGPGVRIADGKTDVVITWIDWPVREPRVFSSMPPVAYDLEDNPVYKALRKKSGQIRDTNDRPVRVVFLFDAGCELLRYIGQPHTYVHEISGESIVEHALGKLSGIDVVCVFAPFRDQLTSMGRDREVVWNLTCFDRRTSVPKGEYARLEQLTRELPRARFGGYQARDVHRQSGFLELAPDWSAKPLRD